MYEQTLATVHAALDTVFAALDAQFARVPQERQWRSNPESWTIDEILEHVSLTSHFLLLTIGKSTERAVKRAAKQTVPPGESDLTRVRDIGHPDAFAWLRPEHMAPSGTVSSEAIRQRLREQHSVCLALLNQLPDGIGTLHRVQMSVQHLAHLDIYQWLYFLAMHAQRHLIEIERTSEQFRQSQDDRGM